MRKILLILTLLLSTHLYASISEIDERKNDIYYANGILTTEKQAWESSDLIFNATLKDIYNDNITAMLKETNFDLLYNESNGMFWDLCLTIWAEFTPNQ